MRIPIIIVLFFSIAFSQKNNQSNYIWPTDASKYLTSVFAEFRPRHYHSGIDIKTWAKSGYKVFSIEDGEVFRIRVSPFGYGKTLYVKLKDGNYTVFAHLERFSDALEKRVRKEQHRKGRYTIDFFPAPGEFKVKQGEIIAYSGETGIGVPHLHFEIRNSKNQPQNPLAYYPKLKDNLAPVLSQVAFIPLSDSSWVNGSPFKKIYKPVLVKKGKYRLNKNIQINGPFSFAFVAWDKANGVYNKFSIYRFRLFVDNELFISAVYQEFDFADTRLIELDRDFGLWRENRGKFQHTYLHPENKLPFYDGNGNNRVLIISPWTTSELRLEVEDFNGNITELTFNVSGVPPLFFDNIVYHKNSKWSLEIDQFSPIVDLRVDPSKNSTVTPQLFTDSDGKWKLLFPEGKSSFYLNSSEPRFSIPLLINTAVKEPDFMSHIEIDKNILKGIIICKDGLPLGKSLSIEIENYSRKLDLNRFDGFLSCQSTLPAMDGRLNVIVQDKNTVDTVYSQYIYSVKPETAKDIRTDRIRLEFPRNSFYDEAFIYWDWYLPIDMEEDYGIYGEIVNVEPFLQPINHGAYVTLILPDSFKTNPHVGLFYKTNKNKWQFLSANENGICRSKVLSLEKFALKIDEIPPEIIPITLKKDEILSQVPKFFKWKVQDEGSGFKGDQGFSCKLDGKSVIIEFDPEEDLIILPTFDLDIKAGIHVLEIHAVDNLRNTTSLINKFELR